MNDHSPCIDIASCMVSTTATSSSNSGALGMDCAASATRNESATGSQTESFQQNDVLLGRGKRYRHHPGNKRYTDLINENRDSYFSHHELENRAHKRRILASIVDTILEQGRFLKREGRDWVPVTRDQALLKTAQAVQYRQRKTTPRVDKELNMEEWTNSYMSEGLYGQGQAPVISMLHAPEMQLSHAALGDDIRNQRPFMAGVHLAAYDFMASMRYRAIQYQCPVDKYHYQHTWPRQRLPGRRSRRTPHRFHTKRGPPKAPKVPKATQHCIRECNTGRSYLSSSFVCIENDDGGSYDDDGCKTLPGLVRVTSIGSFASVDEPMDVSRSNMNW